MSEKKDQEYFADGLAEELLDLLAQVPDLKVPARSSSFYFRGSSVQVKNVGHELVLPTFSRAACAKRVTPSVSACSWFAPKPATKSGQRPTSETFAHIFKVQDEISAAVVDAFKLRLSSPGPQLAERRTANPEAYDQYLRGKHLFQLGNYDGLLAARDAFQRAIELDPNFGPAFAGLANVEYLTVKDFSDTDQPDVIRRAMDARRPCGGSCPSAGRSVLGRALLRYSQYDWGGARDDLQKALALDPNDVKANRRMVLLQLSLGNVGAALVAQRHVSGPRSAGHGFSRDIGACLTTSRVREPMRGEHSRKCACSAPTSKACQAIRDSLIWRTVNLRPQSASANRTLTTLRALVLPRRSMRLGMTSARGPSSPSSSTNTHGAHPMSSPRRTAFLVIPFSRSSG